MILTCACGKKLRVPDGTTGAVRCPACQSRIPVRAAAEEPEPPPRPRQSAGAPPPRQRPRREDADEPPPQPVGGGGNKTGLIVLALGGCSLLLVLACGGAFGIYYGFVRDRGTDTTSTDKGGGGGGGAGRGAAPKEFKGHEDMVNAIAFSKDGAMLASASRDKTLRVWDVAALAEKKSVSLPNGPVWAVVWTSEGRLVATSGDGKSGGVLSWIDPVTGVIRRKIEVTGKNAGPTRALAVSPDGSRLAWLNGPGTEVISAKLDDPATPLGTYPYSVYDTLHAAFTPDGKKVLLTSNSGTQVWAWETPATNKAAIRRAQYGTQDTTGVTVTGNGLYAVSTNRGVVSLLDPATLDLVENVRDLPTTGVFGVAASPDGKHIASAMENGVRVFDPKTRQEVGRFAAPAGVKFQATCVAYSPDGSKVAAGGGFTVFENPRNFSILLWDVTGMAPPPTKKN